MKKSLLWLLIMLLTVSMLATFSLIGCKEAAPVEEEVVEEVAEEEVEEAAAEEEVDYDTTINILMPGGPIEFNLIASIDKIEELWPDSKLKVEYESLAMEQEREKIALEEAGGVGTYDIYYVLTDWASEFISAGFFEPLNSYMEKHPLPDWPDTFYESLMQKGIHSVDGTYYGTPAHDGPYMIFYRTDIFNDENEKANFKEEYEYDLKSPETFQELLDIGEFFYRPEENFWGFSMVGNDFQATPYDLCAFGLNNGLTYFDEDGKPIMNSEEWVETLKFYKKLFDLSPEASASYNMVGRADFFKFGNLALQIDWTGWATYFELTAESEVVGKLGYARVPKGLDNNNSLDAYWFWAISASSDQKDAAYELIRRFAHEEADIAWTMAPDGTGIGCRPTTYQVTKVQEKLPFYSIMDEILSNPLNYLPFSPSAQSILDNLRIAVQEHVIEGKDAQQVLDKANSKIYEEMVIKGEIIE